MGNSNLNKTKRGMCKSIYKIFLIAPFLVGISGVVNAAISDTAEVVTVRKDCGTADNCFNDLNAMADWIHATRLPATTSPLLVDVGPGSFNGFYCAGEGNITVRGSGRENTVLRGKLGGPNNNRLSDTAIMIEGCVNLTFENLSIRGTAIGIRWEGPGNSTYNNVELAVNGSPNTSFAWYDTCWEGEPRSVHNFFGSSIIAEGHFYNFAYYTDCAETWIYGSEVTAKGVSGGTNLLANKAFRLVGDNAEVQVFGSLVRSVAGTATNINATVSAAQGLAAVSIQDGGKFHMHGGILSANATGAVNDVEVAGISSGGVGSSIHVIGTAFNPVSAGNGIAHRIKADSYTAVSSPFLWSAGNTPPKANANGNSIQSVDGADMFVETDCDASGNCNDAGTETHVMVYNSSCTTDGAWFDSTTGRCRGVIVP